MHSYLHKIYDLFWRNSALKRFLEKLRHRNYCWLVRKYGWAYVNLTLKVAPLNGAVMVGFSLLMLPIFIEQDLMAGTWFQIAISSAIFLLCLVGGVMMIFWGHWNPDDFQAE